jgi:triosephosphate isomerase
MRARIEAVVRQVVSEWLAAGGSLDAAATDPDPRARPLVAANWKMNHLAADARRFGARLRPVPGADLVICPPAILLPVLRESVDPAHGIALGAQNLHAAPKGAFTGEHSAAMIRDAGASHVVVGHSERRALFGETDAVVSVKVAAALAAGLRPILCIGERLEEREAGATFRVLRTQLAGSLAGIGTPAPDPADLAIAYEPVWAIGTGRTATPAQAQEAMAFVRDVLAERFGWAWARRVRLQYGGSVTEKNAVELAALPDVDGFLVGGASLDPETFLAIAAAAAAARKEAR